MSDAICTPFWTGLRKTREVDFCAVPSSGYQLILPDTPWVAHDMYYAPTSRATPAGTSYEDPRGYILSQPGDPLLFDVYRTTSDNNNNFGVRPIVVLVSAPTVEAEWDFDIDVDGLGDLFTRPPATEAGQQFLTANGWTDDVFTLPLADRRFIIVGAVTYSTGLGVAQVLAPSPTDCVLALVGFEGGPPF